MGIAAPAAAPAYAADTADALITVKTTIALMTTEDLSTADLNVETLDGVVTLHGKVPTESDKSRAERATSKIEGVKSVRNLLQIVPNARREAVERTDDEVKKAVEAAFRDNARIADSGITVASVNKGVVRLAGRVTSFEAHLESVQVASAVRGVRRVSSEVVVIPGA
jgi:osmotically-inducible protein OsmY